MTRAELLSRITIHADQCGGRPCLRGLRFRVTDVLELLSYGMTTQQIIEEHPILTVEDIQAATAYAAVQLDHPVQIT